MILKFVLLLLVGFFVSASDPYFGYKLNWIKVPSKTQDEVRELSWNSKEISQKYLADYKQRVGHEFKVPDYYYPNVHFWFLIYTHFGSDQVVLHDKENVSLIYNVLDFSSLREKNLNANVLYLLQKKLADEKLDELRRTFDHLVKEPFSLEPRAKSLYRVLKNSQIHIPINKKKRISFLKQLRDNLRSQTGQKNFISDGLLRAQPYKKFLSTYFLKKELPTELLAIPFLESSFNPRAHSKASALGAWQFMPFIAKHFFPKKTSTIDYRYNIGVASVSAAFLMSQNYKILKSWDIAVTAYNSGTKHLLRTKRRIGAEDVTLEQIINVSDSAHFGFASKNFYSEFLALVHTLAYSDELFPKLKFSGREDSDLSLNFYISKCSFRADKVLSKKQFDDILFHNHHLPPLKKSLQRGVIVIAKSKLPASRFLLIPEEQTLKSYPKNWNKILKNQSCSTK